MALHKKKNNTPVEGAEVAEEVASKGLGVWLAAHKALLGVCATVVAVTFGVAVVLGAVSGPANETMSEETTQEDSSDAALARRASTINPLTT